MRLSVAASKWAEGITSSRSNRGYIPCGQSEFGTGRNPTEQATTAVHKCGNVASCQSVGSFIFLADFNNENLFLLSGFVVRCVPVIAYLLN